MVFLQPCFIRKNTPELRKKLEEFGYKPFGSVKCEWDTGWGLSTDNRLGEFESFDNNRLENIIKCESPDYEDSIDCGTNEELFLALAALRDDTNDYQWFIAQDTMWDEDYNGEITVYYEDGEWLIWNYYSFMEDKSSDFRKATVKEIIEHFNK